MHPVQSDILLVLLFKPEAKFSELNRSGITNDHFTFHIKRLVGLGLIEKTKRGTYSLTTSGKEFANRFDTESVVLERQAKIGVLIGCVIQKKKRAEYLVQQRLKQPYYGFHGFITGKVRWGETLNEAALRELEEETGLNGKFRLVGVKHKMDYSREGGMLEDKYFFVYKVTNIKGNLKEKFEGGKNKWLTEREINNLPDLFVDVEETVEMLKKDKFNFSENKYRVKRY